MMTIKMDSSIENPIKDAAEALIKQHMEDIILQAHKDLDQRIERSISDMALKISNNRKVEQRGNEINISFVLSDSDFQDLRGRRYV